MRSYICCNCCELGPDFVGDKRDLKPSIGGLRMSCDVSLDSTCSNAYKTSSGVFRYGRCEKIRTASFLLCVSVGGLITKGAPYGVDTLMDPIDVFESGDCWKLNPCLAAFFARTRFVLSIDCRSRTRTSLIDLYFCPKYF